MDSIYPWTVRVRDIHGNQVGEVDDYQELLLGLKFNDVSTWSLTVDRGNRLAQKLLTPGAGIVVLRNGNTVLSGTWQDQNHQRSGDQNSVTITGSDDTILLRQREGHPQPGSTAPPYSSTAEQVVTGAATSVMSVFVVWDAGPGAPVVARRALSGLVDVVYGGQVTGRGRWQDLLTLFQELADQGAVNGIPPGFRVVQLSNGLWFETYQPTDRTAKVKFSLGLSNMSEFTYKRTAPEVNYVYVGGAGEGTARTIYEKGDNASIALWGRREGFIDATSAATTTELDAAATKELTDKRERNSFAVTPVDLPKMAFGVHYGLGDRVSAVLDVVGPDGGNQQGDVISDVLRECKIRITPDDTTITPVVGTDGLAAAPVRMFKVLKDLTRRVANQERG